MEEKLLGKFSNIYIMLLYAFMTNDLEKARHYLSDDMYLKYKSKIDEYIKNNETRMFDEANVANISIESKEIVDNFEIVKVKLISRYMDYVIDSNTKKYKYGVNDHRIEKTNILTFKKNKNYNLDKKIYTCLNCGANIDINFNGVCPYCGKSTDLKYKDYILVDLKEV